MIEPPTREAARVVTILCRIVAILAVMVLVGGWLLDVERLRRLWHGWTAMAPLTALLLLLVAIASSRFHHRPKLANILLVITFLTGMLVLVTYFTGARLGLENLNLLFHTGMATPLPELPAPDTAAAFVMFAIALACMRFRNTRAHDFADVVAVTIGIVCVQVLIAYIYHFAYAPDRTGFRQIAPHSTIAVILLAVTVIANRPSWGVFAAMSGHAQSALLLRRLLPITVFSCLLAGLLQVEAMRARVGGIPDIVAWSMTFNIIVLALLLFVTSAGLRRAEATVHQREQDLLQATAVAESASHTKSRFMAVMSHELRTPITAVLGYADMLDAGIAGNLTPEQRKFVDRIRSSGWHLVSIIDAVLLYARGRPADEQVRHDRLDLSHLVSEVAQSFAARAREKKIGFTIDRPRDPVIVLSEHARLRDVLTNLMSNAVKFTENGGVTVRIAPMADKAVVEIIDTGIGIADQYLAHIWEPFEQIEDPHTREQGGIGLGMALTRLLCDQMKIPLSVTSEVGKGTTFTLQLPRAEHSQATGSRMAGRRLLVVDDEEPVRRVMARSLARYGADVTEAANSQEALARTADAAAFDAVVTDISMPGMNGIELAREILSRTPAMPIVFVTGAELSDESRAQLDLLGGRLLRKPFDMSELARTVAAVL